MTNIHALRRIARKPRLEPVPYRKGLRDAKGKTLAELIYELGDPWRQPDPEPDVLDYVRASIEWGQGE